MTNARPDYSEFGRGGLADPEVMARLAQEANHIIRDNQRSIRTSRGESYEGVDAKGMADIMDAWLTSLNGHLTEEGVPPVQLNYARNLGIAAGVFNPRDWAVTLPKFNDGMTWTTDAVRNRIVTSYHEFRHAEQNFLRYAILYQLNVEHGYDDLIEKMREVFPPKVFEAFQNTPEITGDFRMLGEKLIALESSGRGDRANQRLGETVDQIAQLRKDIAKYEESPPDVERIKYVETFEFQINGHFISNPYLDEMIDATSDYRMDPSSDVFRQKWLDVYRDALIAKRSLLTNAYWEAYTEYQTGTPMESDAHAAESSFRDLLGRSMSYAGRSAATTDMPGRWVINDQGVPILDTQRARVKADPRAFPPSDKVQLGPEKTDAAPGENNEKKKLSSSVKPPTADVDKRRHVEPGQAPGGVQKL